MNSEQIWLNKVRADFEHDWYNKHHAGHLYAKADGTYDNKEVQKAWNIWLASAKAALPKTFKPGTVLRCLIVDMLKLHKDGLYVSQDEVYDGRVTVITDSGTKTSYSVSCFEETDIDPAVSKAGFKVGEQIICTDTYNLGALHRGHGYKVLAVEPERVCITGHTLPALGIWFGNKHFDPAMGKFARGSRVVYIGPEYTGETPLLTRHHNYYVVWCSADRVCVYSNDFRMSVHSTKYFDPVINNNPFGLGDTVRFVSNTAVGAFTKNKPYTVIRAGGEWVTVIDDNGQEVTPLHKRFERFYPALLGEVSSVYYNHKTPFSGLKVGVNYKVLRTEGDMYLLTNEEGFMTPYPISIFADPTAFHWQGDSGLVIFMGHMENSYDLVRHQPYRVASAVKGESDVSILNSKGVAITVPRAQLRAAGPDVKFAVGDEVRCIDTDGLSKAAGVVRGSVYRVGGVYESTITIRNRRPARYNVKRFELYTPKRAPAYDVDSIYTCKEDYYDNGNTQFIQGNRYRVLGCKSVGDGVSHVVMTSQTGEKYPFPDTPLFKQHFELSKDQGGFAIGDMVMNPTEPIGYKPSYITKAEEDSKGAVTYVVQCNGWTSGVLFPHKLQPVAKGADGVRQPQVGDKVTAMRSDSFGVTEKNTYRIHVVKDGKVTIKLFTDSNELAERSIPKELFVNLFEFTPDVPFAIGDTVAYESTPYKLWTVLAHRRGTASFILRRGKTGTVETFVHRGFHLVDEADLVRLKQVEIIKNLEAKIAEQDKTIATLQGIVKGQSKADGDTPQSIIDARREAYLNGLCAPSSERALMIYLGLLVQSDDPDEIAPGLILPQENLEDIIERHVPGGMAGLGHDGPSIDDIRAIIRAAFIEA